MTDLIIWQEDAWAKQIIGWRAQGRVDIC